MPSYILAVFIFVCVYVVVAGTDTPTICNVEEFVTEAKLFWGTFCIETILFRGAFALGGFVTGGFWSGGCCLGAFCGASDQKPVKGT